MARLTKAEAAWVKKLQEVMNECPSKRIQAFTIGDSELNLFDGSKENAIQAALDGRGGPSDFCQAVTHVGADLAQIRCPFAVHSTAG
ncbi:MULTISPECIES: hypothetical protein [Halomonadaceae]|uniref:Uncharacterized protein n=1 Tax=Halomonas campaniensis TaxID=213554 RepID=A0A3D0KGR0_9GAMM|nr:hypothetical protein [Halomonas sp. 3F2F]HCA02654.1 hypothetical protein [Halomonas campaniensis]